MSYSSSSSEAEQSLSSASLETTLQGTDITTVVSGQTDDFFGDEVSESASSHQQWSSPRYVDSPEPAAASPVPAPRAAVPTQRAGGRTGAVATPRNQPLERPTAEPPEPGAAAQPATNNTELMKQFTAQLQLQREKQEKSDDMMHKMMMMMTQTQNLILQSPHVDRPMMTGVRHGPSDDRPPSLVPEERREAHAGPPSPPPHSRRGSPTSTISRFRGDGPTQTLQIQLYRASQKLAGMEASMFSSAYTALRKKVADLLAECERHFRSENVDVAWEETLTEQVEDAEAICLRKDQELDVAKKIEKDREARRRDLQSILPKGFGTKFNGEPSTWPAFREQFLHVISAMDQSVSASTIKNMIECPSLKKSVKSIRTGTEVLAELDKILGHSFLNSQMILQEVNNSKAATNQTEEKKLVVLMRQAKRNLEMQPEMRENAEKNLLTTTLLITWAQLLLESSQEALNIILQDSDYGRLYSPIEKFFSYLERLDERISVAMRHRQTSKGQGRNKDSGNKDPPQGERKQKKDSYVGGRSLRSDVSQEVCGICQEEGSKHYPNQCPKILDGSVGAGLLQKKGFCTCCLSKKCKNGSHRTKAGNVIKLNCAKCKKHKSLPVHQRCFQGEGPRDGNSTTPIVPQPRGTGLAAPPLTITSTSAAASVTELRSSTSHTSYVVSNPNALGGASELVDVCVLEGPDGKLRKARVIYDSGATDTVVDFKLASYFHDWEEVQYCSRGVNTTRSFSTHIGTLKIVRFDGSHIRIKALKGELSSPAFTLKKKTIDVPPQFAAMFARPDILPVNSVGDLEVTAPVEDMQVELLVGQDNIAFGPREEFRLADEAGQLVCYRSYISDNLLLSGSRRTGKASAQAQVGQRRFLVSEEGAEVNLLLSRTKPSSTNRKINSTDLFKNNRANLSKIERKFFSLFEDQSLLPIPLPNCEQCRGCPACSDPFSYQRKTTTIKLMNQLVTWRDGPFNEGGGYHIKLLYDEEKLAKVDEGRAQALRRLLATERMLDKPQFKEAKINFNKKVQDCINKGYLVEPKDFKGDLDAVLNSPSCFQPYSFALKDEENLVLEAMVDSPEDLPENPPEDPPEDPPENPPAPGANSSNLSTGKMRARPILDASAIPLPGGESVNSAQLDLPDIHMIKISQILMKLRTCKRFAIGDISEFFFRLHIDPTTTSLTKVLFRRGGLGSGGPIYELWSTVGTMGLKQLTAMSSHVRYKISLTMEDEMAAKALQEAYIDDINNYEKYGECQKTDDHTGPCDDGLLLAKRCKEVDKGLQLGHLKLGAKWISDLPKVPPDCPNIEGVSEDETSMLSQKGQNTSCVGYRIHLGRGEPDGGSIRWRVHRPNSINLQPKLRGARPDWAQLCGSEDIENYLHKNGLTKGTLLSLCSNLYDPLLLSAPFIATARMLFRKVLREVDLPSWKSKVPDTYYKMVADLARDLLIVGKKLKVERRAIIPNPIQSEAHKHPVGFLTLLVLTDGSAEAGCAGAYAHQMFPYEAGTWGPGANFTNVKITCNLLAADVKLTDSKGNQSQVCGELLGKHIGVQLIQFVKDNSLVKFHAVRLCSDSLVVEKCLRKTNACFSIWAGHRIAYIQRSIDVDQSWHLPGSVTDRTVDCCTKYQRTPSSAMNDGWFHGTGVLDVPIQLLPWTDRKEYAVPRIEDLPAQWLSSTAKTLLGLKIPAVLVMREMVEEVVAEVEKDILDNIADRHHTINKAITIVQFMLKLNPHFKSLEVVTQRDTALKKFIRKDYKKIVKQLALKSTKISQGLRIEVDNSNETVFIEGRYGYRAILLPNPKTSSFARLVLRSAHQENHLTSSNRILVKLGISYLFTGGALNYLDRLRKSCTACKRLQPQPIQKEMGEVPRSLRGLQADSTTAWRHQSCDLFGPFDCKAFPGQRLGQRHAISLKTWGLLLCDYGTRAVRGAICEDYSADSVIQALRTLWATTGLPTHLTFDAAQNLTAAGTIFGEAEESQRINSQLTGTLGHLVSLRKPVPFASHRQGLVERQVGLTKKHLKIMLAPRAGAPITRVQAANLLEMACSFVNKRPLVVMGVQDDLGHLTPWHLSIHNMDVNKSPKIDNILLNFHPLTKRAVELQTRLEVFKRDFNIFYAKSLRSYGKWKVNSKTPAIGSIVFILDKTMGKANFLQRFKLGRIEKFLSNHTVELSYMNQSEREQTTQDLIKGVRAKKPTKISTKTCVRDLRSLSVIVDPSMDSEWSKGVDIDQLITDPDQENQEDDQDQVQEEIQENEEQAPVPDPTPTPTPVPATASTPAPPTASQDTSQDTLVPVPIDNVFDVSLAEVGRAARDRPVRQRVRPQRFR